MTAAAPRPIRARPIVLLAALAALGWAGWWIGSHGHQSGTTARPALWHIVKGDRQAWLFGTIHAVPVGESWLSPAIADAVAHSDRLFLEVTGLDAERSTHAMFDKLGRSTGLPRVEARLGHDDARRFRDILRRHPAELRDIDGYESWAAALLIGSVAASDLSLSTQEAGEAVLARRFADAGKPVQGLETIAGQLGLFDRLGLTDQRLLLSEAVRDAQNSARLYQYLHTAWARGDLARLEREFIAPLARSPGLRHVLIDDRNRRWADIIDADLTGRPGTAFIAVGAGHLIGKASLQAQLAQRGWRIARIQ
ncbi:TraB/GumN family protein [Sphingobium nicotianae]|uniref:TraB/GumN family protein n=1 Tax=Sphingobium nicotianae TaxID=2782607 RepID=A0A9X1D9L8_9SPHN|nr:TraB/GumN family protein [Sphingobium nicotianae]MBT2185630.1 TraB/GumN family protein [Sphingobium nicotianae]